MNPLLPAAVSIALSGVTLVFPTSSKAQLTARERTQQPPASQRDCSNVPWERAGLKLSSLGGCIQSNWPNADRGSRRETVVRIRATTGHIEFVGPTGAVLGGVIPAAVGDSQGVVQPTIEIIGTEVTDDQHPEQNTFTIDAKDLRLKLKTTLATNKQFGGVLLFQKNAIFQVRNTSALKLPYGRASYVDSGDVNLIANQRTELSGMQATIQDCRENATLDLHSEPRGQPAQLALSLVTGESRLIGGDFTTTDSTVLTGPTSIHCSAMASSFDKIQSTLRVSFSPEGASAQLGDFRAAGELLTILMNPPVPALAQGNFRAGKLTAKAPWSANSANFIDLAATNFVFNDGSPERKTVDEITSLSTRETELFAALSFPSPKEQQLKSIDTLLSVLEQMQAPGNSPNVLINIPREEIQDRIEELLKSAGLQDILDTEFGKQEFNILVRVPSKILGFSPAQLVLHISPAIKDDNAIIRPSVSLMLVRGFVGSHTTPLRDFLTHAQEKLDKLQGWGNTDDPALIFPIPPISTPVDLNQQITDEKTKSVVILTAHKFDAQFTVSPAIFLIDPDGVHLLGRVTFQ